MIPKLEDYRPIEFAKLNDAERLRIYGASRIFLGQKSEGELGREYLHKTRGIDVSTVAKFRLGYVPFSVNHPFSGRIIMPIMNVYDRLIALSVRPIIDEVKPKYWNESFPKGEHLFGLNIAKYAIAKLGFAIVVEGQMDVMAMHSHGFVNTVGILGGAFTHIHAAILKRWTNQVVFLMDADNAGKEHAERAMEIMANYGVLLYLKSDKDDKKNFWKKSKDEYVPLSFISKSTIAKIPSFEDKMDPAMFLLRQGSSDMMTLISESMTIAGMRIPPEWR